MTIELQRRSVSGPGLDLSALPEDKKKRALELSAYFTVPTMEASHMTIAWFSAMNLANRNRQFSTALNFANKLIEKGTNPKFKETVSTLNPAYH
jgi:coatomer protein complex subunit alpha (xenin)